ncbi:hypothetical protein [Arthrobacter caoxuetaonis]|uniref:Uncharacterized protein n=1 Tax=Arthrobacter caoxuetaonis TaxID=2886935 RepID=A0A9X1MHM8_9MICC|nr:hypothetical protein [Arthrobacter caoxuetaonis]MCC3299420.1 hypothetical protein [Arthrobacter caoxuetaonis]USQ59087.1 hypothetical protein NF551_18450 [Arthrobacter caoxuetaonis]
MSTIKLSCHPDETFNSRHDYAGIYVQGGNGIVIGFKDPAPARHTSFVECFPDGAFIRGEGASVAEADEQCWSKLRAYLDCPGHEWVPVRPDGPAGTCSRCQTRRSDAFTPEELGLFCTRCQAPTFERAIGDPDRTLLCDGCDPKTAYSEAAVLAMFSFEPDSAEFMKRLDAVCDGTATEDPEALDWAYRHLEMKEPRTI